MTDNVEESKDSALGDWQDKLLTQQQDQIASHPNAVASQETATREESDNKSLKGLSAEQILMA